MIGSLSPKNGVNPNGIAPLSSIRGTIDTKNTNKYLSITNDSSEINRDYTILKVSEVEFRIKGYLGFGLPEETTWVKE